MNMNWVERVFEKHFWLTLLGMIVVGLVVLVPLFFYLSRPRSELVTGPDGNLALLVTCSSPGDCIRLAAELCPGGYEEVYRKHKKTKTTVLISNGKGSVPQQIKSWSGALLVRCSDGL